jgi:hypothetical protein
LDGGNRDGHRERGNGDGAGEVLHYGSFGGYA